MVKRCMLAIGLVLSMVLPLLDSSIVHAESPNLVIYQLQTGLGSSASAEYISLYNNSSDAADITGWCVTKSSGSDTSQLQLGCVTNGQPNTRIILPGGGYLTLATPEFMAINSGFVPDIAFAAGLAASSGHIRLLDQAKQEIDRIGWGTAVHPEGTAVPAAASGKILERLTNLALAQDTDNNLADFNQTTLLVLPAQSVYEEELPVDLCTNLDGLQASLPEGYVRDQLGNCQQDVCPNLTSLQIDVPDGYDLLPDGTCQLIPLENAEIIISEILPNATSYDTGREFIELYNPNNREISLRGYVMQIGPNFTKSYSLPGDLAITPGSYLVLSDTNTGIVLPNSSGFLRLIAPAGNVVSDSAIYTEPPEGETWSLIHDTWQYTNQPTPGSANMARLEDAPGGHETEATQASCPVGQYRNPDTNRCRLIQANASNLAPCKPGQERNPETNRCRTAVLGALSNLVPCKDGQERNPETNRCRTVTSSSLTSCGEGQERNPETNRCRKISSADGSSLPKIQDVASSSAQGSVRWWLVGGAVVFALSYAVYEWRKDIANLLYKYRIRKLQN